MLTGKLSWLYFICCRISDAYTPRDVVCDRSGWNGYPSVCQLTHAVFTASLAGVRGARHVALCHTYYPLQSSAG